MEESTNSSKRPFTTPPTWLIPWISRAHIALYKLTSGKIGSDLAGHPGILIRTFGRRSGMPHTICVPYVPDEDSMIVVGSFAGSDKDPDWVKNMRVNPEVIIRDKSKVFWADAQILQGDEHTAKWREVVEVAPWYQDYQDKTAREIPLVRLSFSRPYLG